MTTTNEAKEIAYSRFIALWDNGDPDNPICPYVLDNEEFRPPDVSTDSTWARFVIHETDSAQETLGPVNGRKFTRVMVGTLELYCLPDKGTQKADQLVKTFRDSFEGVTVSGCYFNEVQVVEMGIEGNRHRVNALCKFWCSETK